MRNAPIAREDPGAGTQTRLYAGRYRPIPVHLPAEVAEHMPLFLADWPHEAGEGPAGAPAITLAAAPAGYRLTKVNGEGDDVSHALDAANRVVGALIEAFVAQDPNLVCFHASTVRFKDGLAAFVGDTHMGKSSLSLHLAATGHPFFGDDQLALDLGQDPPAGICLGLAPKVRLPLPPEAAPFGASAPITTIVLPMRETDIGESFEAAPRGAIVKTVLENVYAPHLATAVLVPRVAALAAQLPGYSLRFSDSRRAARLVANRLGAY